MKRVLFLDFSVWISYNQEMWFTKHEPIHGPEPDYMAARRVIVTLYAGESAWLVVAAFIVVSAVIVHEIVTRRGGWGRGKSRRNDRDKRDKEDG